MTPQETKALSKGRIPAAPLEPLINEYVATHDGDRATVLVALAGQAGIHYDTLYDTFDRHRAKSVSFNVADALVCAMGRPDAWIGELAEFYATVDLSRHQCLRVGCLRMIPEADIHCSLLCAQMAEQRKSSQLKTHCEAGHERTPANTYVRPSGGRTCVPCQQAYKRAHWARRKAVA